MITSWCALEGHKTVQWFFPMLNQTISASTLHWCFQQQNYIFIKFPDLYQTVINIFVKKEVEH